MDGHDRGGDVKARQGQGNDEGDRSTRSSSKDVKGIIGCALVVASVVAILAGYSVSLGAGVYATRLCTPLILFGTVMSVLSLRSGASQGLGVLGVIFGIASLGMSWFAASLVDFGLFLVEVPKLL